MKRFPKTWVLECAAVARAVPTVLAGVLLAACVIGPPESTPTPSPPPPSIPAPAPPPAATTPSPARPGIVAAPDRAPAAQARFERVPMAKLPALADADLVAAWPAWLANCRTLVRSSDARAKSWATSCTAALSVNGREAKSIRAYLAAQLDAWQILVFDASSAPTRGRLTGYYEPELVGSRERRGAFTVPLARPPADLLTIDLGATYAELAGARVRGRLVDDAGSANANGRRRVVPYWTREELVSGDRLKGLELLWVDDAIEAFFLQVQGSGRVRLSGGREDGQIVRIGYADTNGHPYRSIGRWLVERGELTLEEASMQGIQAWARANPKRLNELLNQNPSYVFFREMPLGDPSAGPLGSMNVPLAAGVSAAVDPAFTPLGTPIVIDSTHPATRAPLSRLLIAQDTGTAIRGPARVDLFWGTGRAAGEIAGRSRDDVSVWMLLPKGAMPESLGRLPER